MKQRLRNRDGPLGLQPEDFIVNSEHVFYEKNSPFNMKRLARVPMLNHTMGRKRLTPTAIFWLLLLTVSSVFTTKTYAQAPIILDGLPDQWANASNTGILQNGVPGTVRINFLVDSSGGNDDIFTLGTKEDDEISAMHWKPNASATDKGDIRNNAVVQINTANGRFLYFFADRFATNGDAGIGIWVFKSKVSTNSDGTFSGLHTNGDLYIVSHFTGGGGTSDRHLYKWNNGTLVPITLSLAAFQNAVNTVNATVPTTSYPAWTYSTKNAGQSGNPPAGIYPVNSFFEGFINLDSLGGDDCFASTMFISSESQDLGEAANDLVMNGFSTKPEPPAVTSDSSCGPKTMHFTADGSGANCNQLIWYSDAALTHVVHIGSPFDTSLSTTTKFYVVCSTTGGCQSAPDSVTGTVFPVPSKPTTTSDSFCGTHTMHLTASSADPNCNQLKWYSDAGLTNLVHIGSPFDTSLSATTKFYVVCVSSHNCVSPKDSATGTVFPIPAKPTPTSDSSCGTKTLHFTAGSEDPNCNQLKWYSDAALSNLVHIGSPFDTSLSATAKFYVVCVSAHGCVSPKDSVLGQIFPVPAMPAATSDSSCGPKTMHLTAGSDDPNCYQLKWYSDAALSNLVHTGSPFDTSLSVSAKFYVVCVSAHGCVSPKDSATGIVFPIPAKPNTTSDSSCGPKTLHFTATSYDPNCNQLKWYSDAGLSNLVHTGSPFDTSLSATAKFYVVCVSAHGCVSPKDSVLGQIFPVPAMPAATSDSFCGTHTMHLTASSQDANCNQLKWYSDAALSNLVHIGSPFDTSLSATAKFYVVCVSTHGCVSDKDSAIGIVFPGPAMPATTSDSSCGPKTMHLTASSDDPNCNQLKWYSDAALSNLVHIGSPFDTSLNATAKFYVVCVTVNGCVSPKDSATGTVFPIPAKPTPTSDSSCGPKTMHLTARSYDPNCNQLKWYSDAALTNLVHIGSPFDTSLSATAKFYVVCVSSHGCVSDKDSATGTVFPVPAKPTTTSDSSCGPKTMHLTASSDDPNCNQLKWYSDAALTNLVHIGSPFDTSLSATAKFYVVCVSSHNCVSPKDSATGTVFPVPAKPTAAAGNGCGTSTIRFTASSADPNCNQLKWYSDAALTNLVHIGSPFDTSLTQSTKFYVVCVSTHNCVSVKDSATGIINTIPTVRFRDTTVCKGVLIQLADLASPAGGIFSLVTNIPNVISGTQFNTNNSGTGVFAVKYKVTSNGCSDSVTKNITVNNCNNLICTRTQGFFGGGGKLCDGTPVITLLNQLLVGGLTVGLPAPYNSVTVPAGQGQKLHDIMPGGSTPRALPMVGNITILVQKFTDSLLTKQGRINNVLLSQTITLKLNTRMTPGLLSIPLAGTIFAQQATGCGQTSTPKACPGTINQFTVSASVVNYLGANANVGNLLLLADSLLGGALKPGQIVNGKTVPSYSDVNNAIDAFNNGFDECRFLVSGPCPPVRMAQQSGSGIAMGSFTVYPNPSGGTFTIEAEDINTNLDHTQVTITDVTGKVMNTVNSVNGAKMQVTMNNAAPGIYLIIITDANGTYRSKILIQ